MVKKSYIVMVVGSVLYFVFSIGSLLFLKTPVVYAVLVPLVFFLLMSGVIFFLAPALWKVENEDSSGLLKTTLFGKSSSQNEEEKPNEEDVGDKQKEYRHQMWVEGLKREAVKKHDSLIRIFAVMSVATFLFGVVMNSVFGLDVTAIFYIPLWAVAVIWYLQIAIFPKWLTYTSFCTVLIIRVAVEFMGLEILGLLPNFIMLPVFYLLMMFFMYGSIMLPNLAQIKYFRPGEGSWEVQKGSTRGQFGARGMVETQIDRFVRYAKGLSNRKPSRGMVFTGPPGTGKTLLANEIASGLGLPFVQADASAFNAPFMGFGQLIPLIVRARTESLAREFGGAIVFIDEGEILFGARSGMQQPNQYQREVDLYDILDESGTLTYDNPEIRTRKWNERQMTLAAQKAPYLEGKHSVFMMPGGAGGGNSGIFPFLTWMSGTNSAPLAQRMLRSTINTLLDALFIPVTLRGKVLRLSPAKPIESNVMFITATNRFWMFDPAMTRPGRFSITVEFILPDEDERADIAGYYLKRWHKNGYYKDDLITPERIREFAQAIPNSSPAEIEQMIQEAVDIRVQFVAELRRVKRYVDEGKLNSLLENDRKFWARFKNLVYDADSQEVLGWDDERVDWLALMETKSSISFGRANRNAVSETTRRKVSVHEFAHFIALKSFNGTRIKPTLLTVVPRRGSLGMVTHIPHDTKEQNPLEFYAGLIRTSEASWVAEHYFFGQNLPGVTGDLRNATNIACLMIGKFGMPLFDCTEEEKEYYTKIGEILISEPDPDMFNPMATTLLESVLKNPASRRSVAIALGMAAIDAYRLIRRNENVFLEVIPEFLALDEFSGNRLTELWQRLDQELVPLNEMNAAEKKALPINGFAVKNPFYDKLKPEGEKVYQQIVARLEVNNEN